MLAFLENCGGDLATLEKLADAFGRSLRGRALPHVAAHRRGVVAVLYARLRRIADTAHGGAIGGRADNEDIRAFKSSVVTEHTNGHDNRIEDHFGANPGPRLVDAARLRSLPHSAPPLGTHTVDADPSARDATRTASELRHRGAFAVRSTRPIAFAVASDDRALQVHALAAPIGTTSESAALETRVAEISSMLSLIAEKLATQSEDVDALLIHASHARESVSGGNVALATATDRRSSVTEFAAVLLLLLAAVIWFLDWYG